MRSPSIDEIGDALHVNMALEQEIWSHNTYLRSTLPLKMDFYMPLLLPHLRSAHLQRYRIARFAIATMRGPIYFIRNRSRSSTNKIFTTFKFPSTCISDI